MIKCKFLKNGKTLIYEDGSISTFSSSGMFESNTTHNISDMDGALDLQILSVLSSNDNIEIGVFKGNSRRIFKGTDIGNIILNAKDYLRILRKTGKENDISYNQLILLFNENFDMENLIKELKLIEVN